MIAGYEAAAARSRRERARRRLAPQASLAEALALWRIRPELFSAPKDAVRLRGEERARAAWARLRQAWRTGRFGEPPG
ncbi:MAG: hypothetical protein KatS3mg102_1179 [Planctomycetota bacterium]|nr:MAG: hypothetical protein KatS3mg102_1179 [Planctomycetota bacterium]